MVPLGADGIGRSESRRQPVRNLHILKIVDAAMLDREAEFGISNPGARSVSAFNHD